MKIRAEKRKHPRYEAQYGAFAALEAPVGILGPLVNISRGGLAFKYINGNTLRAGESGELVIFSHNDGYVLKGVRYKTVSIAQLVEENPFSSISMQIIGIQFGALTQNQEDLLTVFIENHTLLDSGSGD